MPLKKLDFNLHSEYFFQLKLKIRKQFCIENNISCKLKVFKGKIFRGGMENENLDD
jgi:hypothetical protein